MKQIFTSICIVVLAITLISFVKDWVPYKSSVAHCSIEFPSIPNETVQNYEKFDLHLITYSEGEDYGYVFGWSDLKAIDIPKPVGEILHTCEAGMVKKGTDVVLTDSNYKSAAPYLSFTYRTEDKINVARIYYMHKILYQIVSTYNEKTATRGKADRFVSSFKSLW